MRIRVLFLGFSGALVAAAVGIQGCGGDSSSPGGSTTDAGNDGPTTVPTDSGAKDSGTDTGTDAGCDTAADFTTRIPDASIADGGSTSGICVQCVDAKCKSEVANCNHLCGCQNVADKALECFVAHGGDVTACIGEFTKGGIDQKTITVGSALISCITSSCQNECATASFTDGGDGG